VRPEWSYDRAMERPIVFYDQDCGFCRFTAERLRAWDRGRRLTFATIQGPEGDRWLGALDARARFESWHLVTPDGRIWSSGAAAPVLLRRLPLGYPAAAALATFPATTDRIYAWVARHRTSLGELMGQGACAVDPSRRRGD